MRPTFLILLAVIALLMVQAIRADRTPLLRAVDKSQPPQLGLTVHPAKPTTADLVEVRVGGGGVKPEQALRVTGANAFFVEVLEVPARATYTLGALAPGEYTFSLFQRVPSTPFCSHELLGEVRFIVRSIAPEGSGRLALLLTGVDRGGAQALVEEENPQVSWPFGGTALIQFIPGLETTYRQLLLEEEKVKAVELNSVGSIPECPPPLGPAFAPGSLLVSFQEGLSRPQAEALLRQLPPQLEAFQPIIWNLLVFAKVRVPQGWERLFLRRYLRRPEVLYGWVLPHSRGSGSESEEGSSGRGPYTSRRR